MNFSLTCTALLSLACLVTPAAHAQNEKDDATIYEIQSRWIQERHLYLDGGRVQSGPAEGEQARWVLEPGDSGYHIRNVGTDDYLHLEADSDVLATTAERPEGDRGQWLVESVDAYVTIRNTATGKYINIENQDGPVDSGLDNRPDADNWWSGLWKLVHVAGPKPERIFQAGEVIVTSPAYGSKIDGDTTLNIRAPGLERAVVKSRLPGGRFGEDATIGEIDLDDAGEGVLVFPADKYPHGPIVIRVHGTGPAGPNNYYLMVYNTGGVSWNEGLPDNPPPQAEGMQLVFADDFTDEDLSISSDGQGTTYTSHKPGGGDFSGIPFSDHENPETTPFAQMDTYLRIRADQSKNTTGLISALRMDGTGITANAPAYFECRFVAQSAPGTWPAFWVMTQDIHKGLDVPVDELDIIEAYGGEGPGNPSQTGYWIHAHYWNQGPDGEKDTTQDRFAGKIPMTEIEGTGGASWFETFHTYGVLVGEEHTVYYLDDIEVARHETAKLSGDRPLFFLINFAIGGISGWKIDLAQYDGVVDMYVDYVRVYEGGTP
ncbi:MAG: RICIN domain-containing protein [Phycisphaeraceae bacterium]